MIAAAGHCPEQHATRKEQPEPNPQGDRAIEKKQEGIQREETHGVIPQVSPIAVKERISEDSDEALRFPWTKAKLSPTQFIQFIEREDRPDGEQKKECEEEGIGQSHLVSDNEGRLVGLVHGLHCSH